MLRTVLKPKWLGLLAVLVVLLVAFTFLGLWQLSVARDEAERAAVENAPKQAAVPVSQVLALPRLQSLCLGRPAYWSGLFDKPSMSGLKTLGLYNLEPHDSDLRQETVSIFMQAR